jgi:aminoglycoside phosphotransferase (APT) family kinase protein
VSDAPTGIDLESFARWASTALPGTIPPFTAEAIVGGQSNITAHVRDADGRELVVRRPPLHGVLPTAHDMGREHRIIAALGPTPVPVPEAIAYCADPDVIGAPFYVMERRHGIVLDESFPPDIPPTEERCQRISASAVETLVRLHAIDWQAAGLTDLGRPEGFLARQVQGWIERYDRARTDDYPQVAPLVRWLSDNLPPGAAPTIIHNDFKLNNLLLAPGELVPVVAVLDWEMTTIGDPLFDLAVSMTYWIEPGDSLALRAVLPNVTWLPHFYSRAEFMREYAAQSGRDLGAIDYYLTFAYFKLAAILQQIYARWRNGQTRDERFADFGERVRVLIEHAHARIS